IALEACSSWFLPRIVGVSQAMEWVATGRVFPASEALSGRLVSRIVPGGEAYASATELAREIVDNTSSVSVAVSRQMLWDMLGAGRPWRAHRADSQARFGLGKGPDAAEGVTSFWRSVRLASPAGSARTRRRSLIRLGRRGPKTS